MKNCFTSIMPDSLTGAILAVEGIKEAAVVLNGPTGCKLYHSAISDQQLPRELSFDPLNYPEKFYFGQPTVPCTYLDGYDYVYGSSDKLKELLQDVNNRNYKLIAVINSPGAALIGDDLDRLIKEKLSGVSCFSMESTGFSGFFHQGFENALIKILSLLLNKRETTIPKSINLIGISIYDKYYEGNIKEIKRLLSLCGIKVISNICAGESIENIKRSLKAECNIVLYPEYGLRLAKWMEKEYGIPYISPDWGVPIGFYAVEKIMENVCNKFRINKDLFNQDIEKAKARAYLYLSRFSSITGLPKASTFSIRAEASTAYTLSKWLYSYLGMIPVSIEIIAGRENVFYKKLLKFLKNIGCTSALKCSIKDKTGHIVFGDGNTIVQLKSCNKKFTGVEIGLPSLGYINIIPKTIFGIKGAMIILEQIINGLQFTLN